VSGKRLFLFFSLFFPCLLVYLQSSTLSVVCFADDHLRFYGSDGQCFLLGAVGIVDMLTATPVPPEAVVLNACNTRSLADVVQQRTRVHVAMGWVGRVPGGQCLAMVRRKHVCSRCAIMNPFACSMFTCDFVLIEFHLACAMCAGVHVFEDCSPWRDLQTGF
jgi:hypothetical protein